MAHEIFDPWTIDEAIREEESAEKAKYSIRPQDGAIYRRDIHPQIVVRQSWWNRSPGSKALTIDSHPIQTPQPHLNSHGIKP